MGLDRRYGEMGLDRRYGEMGLDRRYGEMGLDRRVGRNSAAAEDQVPSLPSLTGSGCADRRQTQLV